MDNVTKAELDLIEELLREETEEHDFENVKTPPWLGMYEHDVGRPYAVGAALYGRTLAFKSLKTPAGLWEFLLDLHCLALHPETSYGAYAP